MPVESEDENEEKINEIQQICDLCNIKKKDAKIAQQTSDVTFFCMYVLQQDKPIPCIGSVLMISETSLEIYVMEFEKEKKIYFETIDNRQVQSKGIYAKHRKNLIFPKAFSLKKNYTAVDVLWEDCCTDGNTKSETQTIRVLAPIPLRIFPMRTVPLDFGVFLISPFDDDYLKILNKYEIPKDLNSKLLEKATNNAILIEKEKTLSDELAMDMKHLNLD